MPAKPVIIFRLRSRALSWRLCYAEFPGVMPHASRVLFIISLHENTSLKLNHILQVFLHASMVCNLLLTDGLAKLLRGGGGGETTLITTDFD